MKRLCFSALVAAQLIPLALCQKIFPTDLAPPEAKSPVIQPVQIIIESTAVSLTASLLCELVKRKIKVIFCDEKRNPCSELLPYYGSHDTSEKIRTQMEWGEYGKGSVWTKIIREKIKNQRDLLRQFQKKESELLDNYLEELTYRDKTNREGHAAKVYFNALFGTKFTRSAETPVNAALNYGYAIFLSSVNREIVSNGYITQIGIFHDNMFNDFNLGSDLVEPLRMIVDEYVYTHQPEEFGHNEKMALLDLLNQEVWIDGRRQVLNNAIKIYCKSVFEALKQEDAQIIRFIGNEL